MAVGLLCRVPSHTAQGARSGAEQLHLNPSALLKPLGSRVGSGTSRQYTSFVILPMTRRTHMRLHHVTPALGAGAAACCCQQQPAAASSSRRLLSTTEKIVDNSTISLQCNSSNNLRAMDSHGDDRVQSPMMSKHIPRNTNPAQI